MNRRHMNLLGLLALVVAGMILVGCKSQTNVLPLRGTIDERFATDSALQAVAEAMQADRDTRYEILFNENTTQFSVQSLQWCAPEVSSEGYGIRVRRGNRVTHLPNLQHGRNPRASYDAKNDVLWLACGVMEGTGVAVEQLHQLRFRGDGEAYVAWTLHPYDVQQALLQRLGYSCDGDDITFYDARQPIASARNTVKDMGGLDADEPLWIGEQIAYDLGEDGPTLRFTPGVKFVTGLVLTYDDMPTLVASIARDGDGTAFKIGSIAVAANGAASADASSQSQTPADTAQTAAEPLSGGDMADVPVHVAAASYEGRYVDSDGSDCGLTISPARDGSYDVAISILRLATFDDGYGELTPEGLKFTATDPAGGKIGGIITRSGNTAVVTFTDSHWDLLQNGDQFVYTKAGAK